MTKTVRLTDEQWEELARYLSTVAEHFHAARNRERYDRVIQIIKSINEQTALQK